MNKSEHINELAAALAKAQAKIEAAPKDKTAKVESREGKQLFSYKYATLAGVWEACRAPLAENGIAVVQTVTTEGNAAHVSTLMAHSSGQWIEETLTMTAADGSPQKIGSAITYGRRYALGAMVGVVTDDDDDGKGASDNHSGQGYQRPAKTNGNHGKPPPPQQAAAQPPPEEQLFIRLTEALPEAFVSQRDKDAWQALHRAEAHTMPQHLQNALRDEFQKVPVRA